jgi:hypothetical protein
MKVVVLAKMNWESKVDHAMKVLDLKSFFEGRDYGSSVTALGIAFVCLDPALNLKQEVSFSKEERMLLMDIMLHLPDMLPLSHAERRRILADRLVTEVPEQLRRHRFPDFDYAAFESDWTKAVTDQLLGEEAARFDHLCKPQATISAPRGSAANPAIALQLPSRRPASRAVEPGSSGQYVRTTPKSFETLRLLRAEKKFLEGECYPGAPDEEIRLRCQARVDQLIEDVLAVLGRGASKVEILARVGTTMDSFEEEDSEEREKVGDYIGEMMRAIGLDDWTDFI